MAQLQPLIPGEQEDEWGFILNGNLSAINGELISTTAAVNGKETPEGSQAKADDAAARAIAASASPEYVRTESAAAAAAAFSKAETPEGSQAKANQARNDAIKASEPRIPRGTAATGSVVTLLEGGGLGFGAGGGTAVGDATINAKGVVQLAGDLGGTAAVPTTPTALHKTGAETKSGVLTLNDIPVVPPASFPLDRLQTSGSVDPTAVLYRDAVWRIPTGGGGTSSAKRVVRLPAGEDYVIKAEDFTNTLLIAEFTVAGRRIIMPDDAIANAAVGTEIGWMDYGSQRVEFATPSTGAGNVEVVASRTYVESSASLGKEFEVPMPAGILDNDAVEIAFSLASVNSTVTWPTVPAGFQRVGSADPALAGPSGAGAYHFIAPAVRAADFLEGAIKTFAYGGTGIPTAAIVTVIRGAHRTSPIDGFINSHNQDVDTFLTTVGNVLELSFKHASTGTVQAGAYSTPPTAGTTLIINSAATAAGDANSQIGGARNPTLQPKGATIGGRSWVSPTGHSTYGATVGMGIRPHVAQSVDLRSSGGLRKSASLNADGVLTKTAAAQWHLGGALA